MEGCFLDVVIDGKHVEITAFSNISIKLADNHDPHTRVMVAIDTGGVTIQRVINPGGAVQAERRILFDEVEKWEP